MPNKMTYYYYHVNGLNKCNKIRKYSNLSHALSLPHSWCVAARIVTTIDVRINIACGGSSYQCPMGLCIPETSWCDGYMDCPDMGDELPGCNECK